MKVAIVHEWFDTYAGSEKVLEQILNIYPKADLFSVVDFLPKNSREFIKNKKVTTTFVQNLYKAKGTDEAKRNVPIASLILSKNCMFFYCKNYCKYSVLLL